MNDIRHNGEFGIQLGFGSTDVRSNCDSGFICPLVEKGGFFGRLIGCHLWFIWRGGFLDRLFGGDFRFDGSVRFLKTLGDRCLAFAGSV